MIHPGIGPALAGLLYWAIGPVRVSTRRGKNREYLRTESRGGIRGGDGGDWEAISTQANHGCAGVIEAVHSAVRKDLARRKGISAVVFFLLFFCVKCRRGHRGSESSQRAENGGALCMDALRVGQRTH